MGEKVINVANDFSRAPIGRYISDGPNSGERFRNEFLKPALAESEKVIVQFDGTRPIGSSFLEESFGGLIRDGFDKSALLKKFVLKSSDPSLLFEIKRYMNA